MDTLVSLAVAASFGWSVYALLFGGAGMAGMRMPFAFTFNAASGQTLYLEVAAGVTAAVLAGRYLEARAKDHGRSSALAALAALGAKTRRGAARRSRAPGAGDRPLRGGTFVVRPGEKIATNGVVSAGSSAVDASLVTGESMPAEVGAGQPGHRGYREHERPPRRPRYPGRRGHAARSDHPAGHACAGAARPARSGSPTVSRPSSCPA